jgi:SAM-dependent methyltransferase
LAADLDVLRSQERAFGAALYWLLPRLEASPDPEEREVILHALRHGSDNAEGIPIPAYVVRAFAQLPARKGGVEIPNYIELALTAGADSILNLFLNTWSRVLAEIEPPPRPLRVLEAACGSANDFRFLAASGLARFLEYTGNDLCPANIVNARELFPETRFEVGNVFEIAAADQAFDVAFAHDLFEHLSAAGIQTAMAELARVARHALCLGFFNMDEIADHQIVPFEDYHWNLLSMARMRREFERLGFRAQVVHIGSFLRQELDCDQTHNPNAYTFILDRKARG